MRLNEHSRWPPRWADTPVSKALPVSAILSSPRRSGDSVVWSVTAGKLTGNGVFKTANSSLIDRLLPLFVQASGKTVQVIGLTEIPARVEVPRRQVGGSPSPRSSPMPRSARKYVPYGHLDNEGHGDGNVG